MKQSNNVEGKNKQEKLDYLNALQYSIILKKKGEKFSLIIPELSLVVLNENLDRAYSELFEEKQKLFSNILDSELEDEIQRPKRSMYYHDTLRQLKLFIYKLLIICTLGGLALTISGTVIVNKISRISVPQILSKGGATMLSGLDSKLSDATEEVKQGRIKKVQSFVESLLPYSQIFQTLFVPSPCERTGGHTEG